MDAGQGVLIGKSAASSSESPLFMGQKERRFIILFSRIIQSFYNICIFTEDLQMLSHLLEICFI